MKIKTHPKILYNPNTRLGDLQPYVLIHENRYSRFKILYFHVSEMELFKLEEGQARCLYGRQEWGPWCELRVWRYRVISFKILQDKEKIKELEEELCS